MLLLVLVLQATARRWATVVGPLDDSTTGVMIESRSHQAARFGLRALGRHPVISSTLRSSSAQRPLFA